MLTLIVQIILPPNKPKVALTNSHESVFNTCLILLLGYQEDRRLEERKRTRKKRWQIIRLENIYPSSVSDFETSSHFTYKSQRRYI